MPSPPSPEPTLSRSFAHTPERVCALLSRRGVQSKRPRSPPTGQQEKSDIETVPRTHQARGCSSTVAAKVERVRAVAAHLETRRHRLPREDGPPLVRRLEVGLAGSSGSSGSSGSGSGSGSSGSGSGPSREALGRATHAGRGPSEGVGGGPGRRKQCASLVSCPAAAAATTTKGPLLGPDEGPQSLKMQRLRR